MHHCVDNCICALATRVSIPLGTLILAAPQIVMLLLAPAVLLAVYALYLWPRPALQHAIHPSSACSLMHTLYAVHVYLNYARRVGHHQS
jgi:hypothetical protein